MEILQPKLRFPEFKEEWEKKNLGQIILKLESGVSVNSVDESIRESSQFGILKTSCISSGRFYSNQNKTIIDEDLKRAKLNPIKNSILISRMNTPQLVGESGYIDKNYPNLFIPDRLWMATVNNEFINSKLLSFILSSEYMMGKISDVATGTSGSMKNISKPNFLNLEIKIPSIQEQTRIANFLSSVDEKLNLLKEKKALLEEYKKGIMQKIFNQEIRFKNDNGENFEDWEDIELGSVLDYIQPTKYIVKSTDYDNSFEIPVLTAGKTFILGYTDETENIFSEKLPVIIFDDFTTANKYVDFPFKVKSSAMKILVCNNGNVNIKYIYEFIQTLNFATGDEHKRYWISEYSRCEIQLPCLEEQTKIANFLSAIDKKIELVSTQIEETQEYKKGLLQQMFV